MLQKSIFKKILFLIFLTVQQPYQIVGNKNTKWSIFVVNISIFVFEKKKWFVISFIIFELTCTSRSIWSEHQHNGTKSYQLKWIILLFLFGFIFSISPIRDDDMKSLCLGASLQFIYKQTFFLIIFFVIVQLSYRLHINGMIHSRSKRTFQLIWEEKTSN